MEAWCNVKWKNKVFVLNWIGGSFIKLLAFRVVILISIFNMINKAIDIHDFHMHLIL